MSVVFWPSVFLAMGLLLLLVEVFIPSGGMIGLGAIACLVLCLWYAFAQSLALGATFMLIDLVALPVTVGLAFSLWSRTPVGRKFFLRPPAPEEIAVSHTDHHLDQTVGQVGRTLTPLRPCGHVEIDGRRLDALAEDGFVPADILVRVIRTRSGQLVVRALLDSPVAHREELGDSLDQRRPDAASQSEIHTAEAVPSLEEAP
jgi:membrane-bound ClpP family serine protease